MKKILIVDDEKDVSLTLGEMLKLSEYEVDICSTVAQACEKIRNNVYDLIFSDVRMPGGGGQAVLRCALSVANQGHVVFISGYTDLNQESAKKIGAYGLIHKPFNFVTIREVCSGALPD